MTDHEETIRQLDAECNGMAAKIGQLSREREAVSAERDRWKRVALAYLHDPTHVGLLEEIGKAREARLTRAERMVELLAEDFPRKSLCGWLNQQFTLACDPDEFANMETSDEALARLAERDDRRRQPAAFRVGDDNGLTAFHDSHHGVGCTQVDADDFAHVVRALRRRAWRLRNLLSPL